MSQKDLFSKINQESVNKYQSYLVNDLKLSPATIKRRFSSIRKFCEWATHQDYLEQNPFKITSQEKKQTIIPAKKSQNILSKAYKAYHNIPATKYFHYAILIVFCAAVGFGFYDQFFKKAPSPLAYPTSPISPNRYLSFQGRLTDSSNNPISVPTDITFKLWNIVSGGDEGTCTGQAGEECLWNSQSCTIEPDQDGIFSLLLGTTSGPGYTCSSAIEIPEDVFTKYYDIWLGIEVESDGEMDPRMQIATVGYALSAETLQGLPPGTGPGNIPYIDSTGKLVIGAASPTIQATSGTFALEGQTGVTIQAASGQDGSITLSPKGSGTVNLTSEATTGNLLNNQGGVNFGTSGGKEANNLYYGYVGLDTTNFNLLKLESGETPTAKFTVDASGNASAAGILKAMTTGSYFTGDITVSGGDITGANSVVLDIGEADSNYITSSVGLAVGGSNTYYINSSGTGNLNALTLAGDLIVDTSDLFVDVSENRIGIGTTSPTERLTVAGNATISGTLALGPQTLDYAGTCDTSNAGKMYYDGDANKYYFCNGTSWTEMGASAASYWALSGNNLYPVSTDYNVGIGTSTPNNKFSVVGSADVSDNLGIGTTGPIAKFEVSGTNTGKALAIFNETGTNDILNASSSGILKARINNEGYLDVLANYTDSSNYEKGHFGYQSSTMTNESFTFDSEDESDYLLEDLAYAVTLTPSATTGNITLTLGSGNWNTNSKIQAGMKITGNGGVAKITEAPTASSTIGATVTTPFTDTSAIASGSWHLYGTEFKDLASTVLSDFQGKKRFSEYSAGPIQGESPIIQIDTNKFLIAFSKGDDYHGVAIVASVSGTDISYGPEYVFETNEIDYDDNYHQIALAKLDTNKVLITYLQQGNYDWNDEAYAVVANVSGTTISYGTPIHFPEEEYLYKNISAAQLDTDKAIVAYSYGVEGGDSYAVVASVSGTTITWGSSEIFYEGWAQNEGISVVQLDTDKAFIAYDDYGISSGYGIVASVSGTTITYGSESMFSSGDTNFITTAKLDTDKVLVAYYDNEDGYSNAIVASVSGTTISWGAESTFNATYSYFISAAQLTTDKAIIGYTDDDDGYGYAIVASVSETTITYGSKNDFKTNFPIYIFTSQLATDKAIVSFIDDNGYGQTLVASVSGTDLSYGSEFYFHPDSSVADVSVAQIDTDKVLIAYQDLTDSSYGKAVVASISDNTISYGVGSTFNGAPTGYIAVAPLTTDKAIIGYYDEGDEYGNAIVASVSGTTISWGVESTFNAAEISDTTAAKLDTDKAIIGYFDGGDEYGNAIVASVSDTTISWGAESTFNAGTTAFCQAVPLATDKAIVAYYDGGDGYGNAIVASVSDTTISWGAESTFNAAYVEYIGVAQLTTDKAIIGYYDGGDEYGNAIVASVSNTTISYGSEANFTTNAPSYVGAAQVDTDKAVIVYQDSDTYGKAMVASVSGTNISLGNESTFNSYETSWIFTAKLDTDKAFVAFDQDGGSGDGFVLSISGTSISDTEDLYPLNNYYLLTTSDTNHLLVNSWSQFNSITVNEVLNGQTINYGISFDGRTTWKIYDTTGGDAGWRPIARDNSGTWEYNSNSTAGATDITWTSATTNTQFGALDQAFQVAANQMTGTEFNAITDSQWEESGGFNLGTTQTLDFGFGLKSTVSYQSPSLEQITIEYEDTKGILTFASLAAGSGVLKPMQFLMGPTVALYIDTIGNVGVGTTNPQEKLDVAGSAIIGTGSTVDTLTLNKSGTATSTVQGYDSSKLLFKGSGYYNGWENNIVEGDEENFSGEFVGEYSSLQLDVSGYPVISYFDKSNHALKVVHCNDALCNGDDETINTIEQSSGNFFHHTSLQLDTDGYPVISYYDYGLGVLKLAYCDDVDCASSSVNTVDDNGDVGDYSSLQLDSDGYPVISYFDASSNGYLKVAHCNDPYCSGDDENINTADDSIGAVGRNTSLQLDGDGYPVISYTDGMNEALKVTHCNDVNCAGSDENINTVVSGSVYYDGNTSLQLDGSGYPTIAYIDGNDGYLQFAHCNDVNCAGSDETINTVEDSGTSSYCSLQLDVSGYPVIAYAISGVVGEDITAYLELAQCNDANCAGSDETKIIIGGGTANILAGNGISLQIDSNSYPVVSYGSYVGEAAHSLRLARQVSAAQTSDVNFAFQNIVTDYSDYRLALTNNAGNELFTVGSNGYVGIGTSSPQANLDVAGTSWLGSSDGTGLYVDSLGNVGIGTQTPTNQLSVSGNTDITGDVDITGDTDIVGVATVSDSLGIGTTNPSAELDVAGDAIIGDGESVNTLTLNKEGDATDIDQGKNSSQLVFKGSGYGAMLGFSVETIGLGSTGDAGQYASLQLDSSEYPVISYYDADSGDLKLVHCNDISCSGNDETVNTVDSAGDVGQYTSLQLDASGYPVISYYDVTNGDLKLAHCNDVDCSGGNENINTVISTNVQGQYTSLVLDASGYPKIAYYDDTGGDLELVSCNDVNCAGSNETNVRVNPSASSMHDISMVLDTSGYPVIAYTASSWGRVEHCTNATCSAKSSNSLGFWPQNVSLQLDDSGYPIISYNYGLSYDGAWHRHYIYLQHCDDANCAGTETGNYVDSGESDVIKDSSLQLNDSGYPVIAFWDAYNGDLNFTSCTDANCSGAGETVTTIDSTGDVGQYVSLQLDDSDRAVIAYYDATNGDLKLARYQTINDTADVNFTFQNIINTFATYRMALMNNDGSEIFNVSGSGNVGIGTTGSTGVGNTALDFKLQVAGNIGPDENDLYDLGSDTLRWANLYLAGDTLHLGTNTSDEGTLAYDTNNNNLLINSTGDVILQGASGNVGIGTTNPQMSLDIAGNATISGTLSLAPQTQAYAGECNAASEGKMYYDADAGKYYYCDGTSWGAVSSGVGGSIDGSGTANFLTRWHDSDTLTNSILYEIGSNIGVGTTNPQAKLDIAGTAWLRGSTADDGLYVDSSGNVGIGTTGPQGKLEVNGETYLDGWTHAAEGILMADGKSFVMGDGYDAGLGWSAAESADTARFYLGTSSKSLLFVDYANRGKNHDHNNQADPTLIIHSATDPDSDNTQWLSLTHDKTNGVINTGKGNLTFGQTITSDTDSTDDLGTSAIYWANAYIDKIYLNSTATLDGSSDGDALFSANVGIGTTNATSLFNVGAANQLAVDSSGNLSTSGTLTAATSNTLNGISVNSGTITAGTWNGNEIAVQYGGTGQNWSAVAQGSLPYFSGTGIMATLAPSDSGYVLQTNGAGANPSWVDISSTAGPWTLVGSSLYPDSMAYNVGIGTSSPTNKLSVLGSTDITGNLGIGTTGTTFKLQVAGSVGPDVNDTYDLGSDSLRWANLYLAGDTLHLGTNTSDEGTLAYDTNNNNLLINSTENVILQSTTGNVGIGITSPTSKLEINGTNTGKPLVSLNETGTNDILTASVSGRLKLSIDNDGYLGIYAHHTDPNNYERAKLGYETGNSDYDFDFNTADESDFSQEDLAYSTTLTPSATTGDITLTLGTGNWNTNSKIKQGSRVIGNSGVATIMDAPSASSVINAHVDTAFANTNAIASGDWSVHGTKLNSLEQLVLNDFTSKKDFATTGKGEVGTANAAQIDTNKILVAYSDYGPDTETYKGMAVVASISGTTISYGSEAVFLASGWTASEIYGDGVPLSVAKLDTDKALIAYPAPNSYYGKVIVASVSGTTIAFGNESTFYEEDINWDLSLSPLATNKALITYVDDDSSSGYALVASVSGVKISYGSSLNVCSYCSYGGLSAAQIDTDKALIAYYDSDLEEAYAVVASVSGTTISLGSAETFNSNYISSVSVSQLDTDKALIAYDDSDDYYGNAIVASVSGTSISYGSEATFNFAEAYGIHTTKLDTDKVLIAYVDDDNYYGTAIVASVSETTISLGSPEVFDPSYDTFVFGAVAIDTDKAVLLSPDYNIWSGGKTYVASVSGTTISLSSAQTLNQDAYVGDLSATKIATDKILITYSDYNDSAQGKAIVASISGNNISYGIGSTFADNASYISVAKLDTDKALISYTDDDDYGNAIVASVSGTTISYGSPEVFADDTDESTATVQLDTNKALIVYNYDGYGEAVVASVSDTTISLGSPENFNYDNPLDIAAAKLDTDKVLITYNGSGDGTAVVASVSGTTISYGSDEYFSDDYPQFISTVNLDTDKALIIYSESFNDDYGYGIGASVSGTTISLGTAVNFGTVYNSGEQGVSAAKLDTDKALITYINEDNNGIVLAAAASGLTITFGSENTFSTDSTFELFSTDLGTNKALTAFSRFVSTQYYGTASIIEADGTAVNSSFYPDDNYYVTTTSDGSQLSVASWSSFDPPTVSETLNGQTINYGISFDGRTTWKIYDTTGGDAGWRPIARDNSGTWEYNSNSTAGATDITWTSATTNTQFGALDQAFQVAANQMTGYEFNNITTSQWPESGGFLAGTTQTIDFAYGLKTTSKTATPKVSQISFDGVNDSKGILALASEENGNGLAKSLALKVGSINALLIDASGNIGIGTTSPTSKLDVAGTVDLRGAAGQIGLNVNADGEVGIGTNTQTDKLDVAGTVSLRGAAGQTGLYVDDEGLVGIGTDDPLYTLTVGGTSYFAGGIGVNLSPSYGIAINAYQSISGDGDSYVLKNDARITGYGYGTPTATGVYNYIGIASFGSGGTTPTGYGTYNSINTYGGNSYTEIGYGNFSSLRSYSNDRVYGNYVQDDSGNSTGGTQYGLYVDLDDTDTTNYSLYIEDGSGISYFGSNVGFGTTGPQMALDVAGDATVSGTLSLGPQTQAYAGECNATSEGKMYYDAAAGKYYYCNGTSWGAVSSGVGGSIDGSGTANYLTMWQDSDTLTNSSLYEASGNIGIGTTDPTEKLNLAGGNFIHTVSGNPTQIGIYETDETAEEVFVSDKYAYVVTYDGLFIIDINNPSSPSLVGSYAANDAESVYVSSKYAYVGTAENKFHIVDISNPASPSLVSNYETSYIESVYVSGKYVYLTSNDGLQIVDISNPASPSLVGQYDEGEWLYGLYVSGKYAYLTDPNGLYIVDINNPTSPTLVGTSEIDWARNVYVSGKYAYVVTANDGLQIVNVGNPASPSIIGAYKTTDDMYDMYNVYIAGKYAYVADDNGLEIIDVSDPTSPSLVGVYGIQQNFDVQIVGKYAYVTTAYGLEIVDINGIETPSLYAGNFQSNNITITENGDIGNNLYVGNAINIGLGGLFSKGYIATEGNGYFSGNVGIGTKDPDSKLEINASPDETPFKINKISIDTEILRPNADGDTIQLDNFPDGTQVNNWSYVDEVIADEDTTALSNTGPGVAQLDLYNLPSHSSSGTIDKITVYTNIVSFTGSEQARIAIKTGGTTYYSGNLTTAAGTWEEESYEWSINPDTSSAWTWEDIDALQVGIELTSTGAPILCTQLYVEVSVNNPSSTSTIFIVDSSGNIGIGTSNPQAKLDVAGDTIIGDGNTLNNLTLNKSGAADINNTGYDSNQLVLKGSGYGYSSWVTNTAQNDGSFYNVPFVLDDNDYPVIVQKNNDDEDLEVIHCNDIDCDPDNDEYINAFDNVNNNVNLSLELDSSGYPVISYQEDGDLMLAHCNDVNCDDANENISTVIVSGEIWHGTFKLDTSGYPVMAYIDDTDLKITHCNDANCAGSNETTNTLASGTSQYSNLSLQLDASGYPVVSYYDSGDLMLAHCNDVNCAGGNENINAVDETGSTGYVSSLKLDDNGYPVIAYVEENGYEIGLKIAHCNDVNCAGDNENINSLNVSITYWFESPQLQLNNNGYPVIAYIDGVNNNPKVILCNDVNCAGDNESINTVENVTSYMFASLQLDSSDNPVVVYQKNENYVSTETRVATITSSPAADDVNFTFQNIVNGLSDYRLAISNGTQELFTVTSSGNVGIGDSNPSSALTVVGDGSFSGGLSLGEGLFVYQADSGDNQEITGFWNNLSLSGDYSEGIGIHNYIDSYGADEITYGIYNRLMVSGAGSYTYGVYNRLETEDGTTAYGNYITDTFNNSNGGTQYGLYVDLSNPSVTNYSLYVEDGSGISYFGSNVGIGTADPQMSLDVAGDATVSGTLSLAPQTQAYAGACNTAATGKMYYDAGKSQYLYCNGTDWTEVGTKAGIIVAWSGAIVDIPAGWVLCDGNNGTPDLRGRFIYGAGGSYAVGATGGEETHTLTIAEMPAHTHNVASQSDSSPDGGTGSLASEDATNLTISNAALSRGGDQPHNNLPPYYALAYIMKTANGADLAEWIPASDPANTTAGTIVSIDPNNKENVLPSNQPYDSRTAGIITTAPDTIMGLYAPGNVQMALAGRVPVKVSLINGEIKPGDPITSSVILGVGMKATQKGQIVGKAMEALTAENANENCFTPDGQIQRCGTVLAFVNVSWYDPEQETTTAGVNLLSNDPEYNQLRFLDNDLSEGDLVGLGYSQINNDLNMATDITKVDLTSSQKFSGVISKTINGKGDLLKREFADGYSQISAETRLIFNGNTKVKIASSSPNIQKGDFLAVSSIPGMAQKALKPGAVIGKALEDWSPDSGKEKINVLVGLGWHDPDIYLTSTGELNITNDTQTADGYQLKDTAGNVIERVGAFAEIAVAKIKAGIVKTQELVVEKKIVSPLAEITEINSQRISLAEISSSSEDNNLTINLENQDSTESSFSKLIVKGEDGQEVASIDAQGNASFAGILEGEGLLVEDDATVAGTLYADEIITRHGKFGDLIAATISAVQITQNITNIYEQEEASPSGLMTEEEINNLINEILASAPEYTEQAGLDQDIEILPDSTTGTLANLGSLMIGNSLTIADDSLNTIAGPLYLQSLGLGGIDILAGKIIIDSSGNAVFEENLTVKGTLAANEIAPLENQDLTISLANSPSFEDLLGLGESAPMAESSFGKLLVKGVNNEVVASIDASGSAQFASLGIEADYTATQSGVVMAAYDNWQENGEYSPAIKTNATAGIGVLPTYESEVMIYNPKITDQSLIYITPITNTENKVIYVKAKKAQKPATFDTEGNEITVAQNGWFKVAIDMPIAQEIQFNWWIVN